MRLVATVACLSLLFGCTTSTGVAPGAGVPGPSVSKPDSTWSPVPGPAPVRCLMLADLALTTASSQPCSP